MGSGLEFGRLCLERGSLPAGKQKNCALQAAYNHAAKQAWNVDFSEQYSRPYSEWKDAAEFAKRLANESAKGFYPSRLEGRVVLPLKVETHVVLPKIEYRARFAPQTGTAAPNYMYGQSCSTVLSALESAPADTPLVSLQRFWDPNAGAYLYQAVWSAPIPQLP